MRIRAASLCLLLLALPTAADAADVMSCTAPPGFRLGVNTQASWPVIHANDAATKVSAVRGPGSSARYELVGSGAGAPGASMLSIADSQYLYAQADPSAGSILRAFRRDPSGSLIVDAQADLGAPYPQTGGGAIDTLSRVWFTKSGGRLIRFCAGLQAPVESGPLATNIPAANRPTNFNSVTLMIDNTVLVGTMDPWLFVVGSEPDSTGKLPLLATLDFLTMTDRTGTAVLAGETNFNSRPVTERIGGKQYLYQVSRNYLTKLVYVPASRSLSIVWATKVPKPSDATLAVSNPIIVGAWVCATSHPANATSSSRQRVVCLDKNTGQPTRTMTAFPNAPRGAQAWHTLGSFVGSNGRPYVVTILTTTDASGGIAALDLTSGKVAWVYNTANISESFAISQSRAMVYFTRRTSPSTPFQIVGLDLATGQPKLTLDIAETTAMPSKVLPSLLSNGDLIYPVAEGLIRVTDS